MILEKKYFCKSLHIYSWHFSLLTFTAHSVLPLLSESNSVHSPFLCLRLNIPFLKDVILQSSPNLALTSHWITSLKVLTVSLENALCSGPVIHSLSFEVRMTSLLRQNQSPQSLPHIFLNRDSWHEEPRVPFWILTILFERSIATLPDRSYPPL